MKELQDLVAAWKALPSGSTAVLATVVGTTGSTYRKPGARMLITESGWASGSVSGGCLEGDVVKTAWERTENGPALVTYDATSEDDIVWGFGLGCNGSVTVLFERIGTEEGPVGFIADCFERRCPGVLTTVLSHGPSLGEHTYEQCPDGPAVHILGKRGTLVTDGLLFESILPPFGLTIFGAGHDAIPLVGFAKGLGWHVTVVDSRPAFAVLSRFPEADRVLVREPGDLAGLTFEKRSAAVVMTHNYLNDYGLLKALLPLPFAYLGQLGPRRRTDRMLVEMAAEGYCPSDADLAKFHAPVGLDLGSESPDEIALAIVAEIQAITRKSHGEPLKGKAGPLHEEAQSAVTEGEREPVSCNLLL